MLIFDGTHQPLTASDIQKVEERMGIRLPKDLFEHYLRFNGGRPEPRYFEKDDEWYGVHYFDQMDLDRSKSSFEESYRILVLLTPEFPRGFIPIASDATGDEFIYSIREKDYGSIQFIQWDYFDEPDRFVVYLADSLSEFLAALADPPD